MKLNTTHIRQAAAILCLPLLLSVAACSSNASKTGQTDSAAPADSVAETRPDSLTFALAGDILMGTTFPEGRDYLPEQDGATMFQDVAPLFRAADLAAANLEGVMIEKGTPKKCYNPKLCFTFRIPPRYARHLADAGIDFMSLANNHAFDFGREGQDSTISYLTRAGIECGGIIDRKPYAILERHGLKVGFIAFGHGDLTLSNLNYDAVREAVTDLASKTDIVVVSLHGGGEGAAYMHVPHQEEVFHDWPRGDVERFAHTAIDAGADIVYGHGPHLTRAIELYRDRIVFYSLGNFCTPTHMGIAGYGGHAPVATVTINRDGSFRSGRLHSFLQQSRKGPRTDETHSVARHIRDLTLSDFPATPLTIADDGTITRKTAK